MFHVRTLPFHYLILCWLSILSYKQCNDFNIVISHVIVIYNADTKKESFTFFFLSVSYLIYRLCEQYVRGEIWIEKELFGEQLMYVWCLGLSHL